MKGNIMEEIDIRNCNKEEKYEAYKKQAQELLIQKQIWEESKSLEEALKKYEEFKKVLVNNKNNYEKK